MKILWEKVEDEMPTAEMVENIEALAISLQRAGEFDSMKNIVVAVRGTCKIAGEAGKASLDKKQIAGADRIWGVLLNCHAWLKYCLRDLEISQRRRERMKTKRPDQRPRISKQRKEQQWSYTEESCELCCTPRLLKNNTDCMCYHDEISQSDCYGHPKPK